MNRETYRGIKNMDKTQLEQYLHSIWLDGAINGLREAEHEFDDAVVLTEDEARERISDEAFKRLMGE